MDNFPSYFRGASPAPNGTGPWGGKPANRRSPLALFLGEPTPRLYDRGVEVSRARPWRFLFFPTGKGFMEARQMASWIAEG
jgi:hypothetical protein